MIAKRYADQGSQMENNVRSGRSLPQCNRVGNLAVEAGHVPLKPVLRNAMPRKNVDVPAAVDQQADQRGTDSARGAGDEGRVVHGCLPNRLSAPPRPAIHAGRCAPW